MNLEALRAAERLRAQLPVRTHEQRRAPETEPRRPPPARYTGARAVKVGRRTYDSITAACRGCHVHPRVLYQWLASGKASYVK